MSLGPSSLSQSDLARRDLRKQCIHFSWLLLVPSNPTSTALMKCPGPTLVNPKTSYLGAQRWQRRRCVSAVDRAAHRAIVAGGNRDKTDEAGPYTFICCFQIPIVHEGRASHDLSPCEENQRMSYQVQTVVNLSLSSYVGR